MAEFSQELVNFPAFNVDGHIDFFTTCLKEGFPHEYTSMDTQRMTAVYFSLSALDMLGALHHVDRPKVIEAVYAWQLSGSTPEHSGFVGTSSLGRCLCCEDGSGQGSCCPLKGHLAMAYTSLASLVILGDDLSRVNRSALLAQLAVLQQPDGCFVASADEGECDMRFLYCACVISHLLGDWSAVDIPRATQFVLSCVTYEGGLALRPGSEAHGGSCYCGLASLMLMQSLPRAEQCKPGFRAALEEFCAKRQQCGFQGRTNKAPDSCYSFWHGGSLHMLDAFTFCDMQGTARFLLRDCQFCFGGFSKLPKGYPDVLHSYYSLCWLAMAAESLRDSDSDRDCGDQEGQGRTIRTRGGAGVGPGWESVARLRALDPITGLCRGRAGLPSSSLSSLL